MGILSEDEVLFFSIFRGDNPSCGEAAALEYVMEKQRPGNGRDMAGLTLHHSSLESSITVIRSPALCREVAEW